MIIILVDIWGQRTYILDSRAVIGCLEWNKTSRITYDSMTSAKNEKPPRIETWQAQHESYQSHFTILESTSWDPCHGLLPEKDISY